MQEPELRVHRGAAARRCCCRRCRWASGHSRRGRRCGRIVAVPTRLSGNSVLLAVAIAVAVGVGSSRCYLLDNLLHRRFAVCIAAAAIITIAVSTATAAAVCSVLGWRLLVLWLVILRRLLVLLVLRLLLWLLVLRLLLVLSWLLVLLRRRWLSVLLVLPLRMSTIMRLLMVLCLPLLLLLLLLLLRLLLLRLLVELLRLLRLPLLLLLLLPHLPLLLALGVRIWLLLVLRLWLSRLQLPRLQLLLLLIVLLLLRLRRRRRLYLDLLLQALLALLGGVVVVATAVHSSHARHPVVHLPAAGSARRRCRPVAARPGRLSSLRRPCRFGGLLGGIVRVAPLAATLHVRERLDAARPQRLRRRRRVGGEHPAVHGLHALPLEGCRVVAPAVVAVADERRVERAAVAAALRAAVRRLGAVVVGVLVLAAAAAVPRAGRHVVEELAARAARLGAHVAALHLLVLAQPVVAHAARRRAHAHAVALALEAGPADHRGLRPLRGAARRWRHRRLHRGRPGARVAAVPRYAV